MKHLVIKYKTSWKKLGKVTGESTSVHRIYQAEQDWDSYSQSELEEMVEDFISKKNNSEPSDQNNVGFPTYHHTILSWSLVER